MATPKSTFIISAENRASQVLKQVSTDFGNLGTAARSARSMLAGLGVGISVGAVVAATRAFVEQGAAISRLATLSGTTTDEFQRLAAGADTVGIGQEKLSDIFKDVQDKVGDFLQNGAGPLKDFFDNIAPQVGVTAEQFRRLSGPQALELYVASLEKANISQNEMTFYMEAIANDATLLLPLLRDGARGFREFGDEAAQAGYVMDQETLVAAENFRKEMITLGRHLEGAKVSIFGSLIPALSALIEEFNAGIAAAGGFGAAMIRYGLRLPRAPGNELADLRERRGLLEEELRIAEQAQKVPQIGRRFGTLVTKRRSAEELREELAQLQRDIGYFQTLERLLTDTRQDIYDPRDRAAQTDAPAATGGGGGSNKDQKEAEKQLKAWQERERAMRDLIGKADAASIFDLSKDTEALDKLIRLQGLIDEQEIKAVADRWKDVIDPTRQYVRQLEEIRALVASGDLSPAEGIAAEFEVQNAMQDQVLGQIEETKAAITELDEFTLEAARNIQDALGQGVFDFLDGKFENIGKSFGNMLKKMAAEAIAADLGRFLLGDFAKSGKVGGAFGGILGAIFGGARADGGPVSGGVPYLVGERGPELFVPKSSGTVMPNGSMGGVTITQHISVAAGASRGEVMTAMRVAKDSAKREIVESMRRGGVFA
jgi:methyl-accepting chemotaxis protein